MRVLVLALITRALMAAICSLRNVATLLWGWALVVFARLQARALASFVGVVTHVGYILIADLVLFLMTGHGPGGSSPTA